MRTGTPISVDVPRYAHTHRPIVRIGWYPRGTGFTSAESPENRRPGAGGTGDVVYMPVCRYESFCHETRLAPCTDDNCRFFFYEPNSATMLALDRTRTAFFPNKVAAFHALVREAPRWWNTKGFSADSWEANVYKRNGMIRAMHGTLPWWIYGCPGVLNAASKGDYTAEYRAAVEHFVADFYEWRPTEFRAEDVPTYSIQMLENAPAIVKRTPTMASTGVFRKKNRLSTAPPTAASNSVNSGGAASAFATPDPDSAEFFDAVHDPQCLYVTPLSPSFGDSSHSICGHSTDKFDLAIGAMARACGLDTIVLLSEVGQTRATTEIVCTDTNPYSRLHWAAKNVANETELATTKSMARCARLCGPRTSRLLFSRPKRWTENLSTYTGIDTDRTLATLWFPSDGLLCGSNLVCRIPIISATGRITDVVEKTVENK